MNYWEWDVGFLTVKVVIFFCSLLLLPLPHSNGLGWGLFDIYLPEKDLDSPHLMPNMTQLKQTEGKMKMKTKTEKMIARHDRQIRWMKMRLSLTKFAAQNSDTFVPYLIGLATGVGIMTAVIIAIM